MNLKQKLKFRKFIKELEAVRGRHTELVSVYVPKGYEMIKIIQHLQQEQGTASNIKDAKTRNNVIDSLEKMIRHLRIYKKTPENGLAVFSGNASENESKVDIKVWSIEPPEPLNVRLYRCDQTFLLDPLKEMMEHKATYGLIVLDRREGDVGLLKGTSVQSIARMTSAVPGKSRAGGQCNLSDTLIQSYDGEILKIKDSHNPYVLKSADFDNFNLKNSSITDKWETGKKKVYNIVTKNPRLKLGCSGNHVLFVAENGIVEKKASELKIGDTLIMPEKIEVKGKVQKINPKEYYNKSLAYRKGIYNKVKLPEILDFYLAQFVGYLLGDGCIEKDRISFFEQSKDVAFYYREKFDEYFNLKSSYRFRDSKNYHQLRFTSRPLVRFFIGEFPEIKKALDSIIPIKILQSNNQVLGGFLKGFFDAEGFVNISRGIGLGINNKILAQQIQLSLLRFSIISSIHEYDNRRNIYSDNVRYAVDITEKKSLELFKKNIGFTSFDKKGKLDKVIKNKSNKSNVRQILVSGLEVRKIIEKAGYNLQLFPKVSSFFNNKRMMSKEVFFDSIMKNIKDKKLYREFERIYNYNLLPVKIAKIEIGKPEEMVDISVKNENFIANGLIVHNSAQRFARIREGAAKEFYKRIAEAAQKTFLSMKNLKGIIIGGPSPTKEEFLNGGYLNEQLKRKVIGMKDLGYTGKFGMDELVSKSQDLLAKEEIMEEKKIMQKFFELLAKEPEKIAYGKKEVDKALEMGAVETLLLSEKLSDDDVEKYEEKAKTFGAELKVISLDTMEGAQLKDLGKIGAILRYGL